MTKSAAYKHADGKKIDGKRVLVDVERARTVKGWLPRRLGGGLGGTRRGGPEVNIKHSGREDNVREKERYRLEREKEDRRGVDDRRGDREFCHFFWKLLELNNKFPSQDSKGNARGHEKRAAHAAATQRNAKDVSPAKTSIVTNAAESLATKTGSEDARDHETGKNQNLTI